jgi:hypothetical protein
MCEMARVTFMQLTPRYCLTFAKVVAAIVMWLAPFELAFGQESSNLNADRNFSLLEGHGVPVCDAYLELLNKTKFTVTPFCGRPDEGPVKGFEHLDGHFMKAEEVSPLFTKVWEFMRFGDQNHTEKYFHPGSISPQTGKVSPQNSYWSPDPSSPSDVVSELQQGLMYVWAFSIPLDVNNNGLPLNVITWQGYGATGSGARCGSDHAYIPWQDSYVGTRAFVLAPDKKSIDEKETRLIFGAAPDAGRPVDAQIPGLVKPGQHPFRPLADSIGIFKFEGRYYIEIEDRPKLEDSELPPVHVLLREHDTTRQVCTLHPESVPVPEN